MTSTLSPQSEIVQLRGEIQDAMNQSNRIALLRHARLGEPVSTWRDGKVVWITPTEIFASYGLDEFGRPTTQTQESN